MCVRHLGFLLLVWFPGVLHAQRSAQPCPAPSLNGGYWVPEQEAYPHGTKLIYACDNGLKPAVEGWWATVTCQNGLWSHEPQCIDEKACLPPIIPNAKYTVNTNGWYEDTRNIRITCDKGYEHRNHDATAQCMNGTWLSVPVCEKSTQTCDEPPKIPHAVVIHRGYQDFFVVDSEVHYKCEDGFTFDGATKKSIFCIAGKWSEGPTCSKAIRPGSGQAASAGSGTRPAGGGSSGSSRLDEKETEPQITTISNCGRPPIVPHGDVVGNDGMALRYQCASFYKRVGPETVVCYSDGTWSKVPICKAAFCSVNTDEYPGLIHEGVKYIKEGERVTLDCVQLDHWWTHHHAVARCTNGIKTVSRCCDWWDLKRDAC